VIWLMPPYALDPFCTYDLTYRLNATIDVDGQPYSAEITHMNSFSRNWIAVMNSAGCQQTHGTALAFRPPDNRVVLMGPPLCLRARRALSDVDRDYEQSFAQAMAARKTVDVMQYCANAPDAVAGQAHGFVVDNADRPTEWARFRFGEKMTNADTTIRLVAATATATHASPADQLREVAPGVLKTYFEHDVWWNSPEAILNFHRRSREYTAKHEGG
jgi:hypothetical protein